MNIDSLASTDVTKLAQNVIDSWQPRNEAIRKAKELREQSWTVPVPPAWRKTAKSMHTSLPKDIAARVVGTLTLRDAVFSRTAPDDDLKAQERALTVARYFQGRFQYDKAHGVPGKNGWVFTMDQLVNKGAACVSVIYAPHDWSGPTLIERDEKGQPKGYKADFWRDSRNNPTDDSAKVDDAATAKYYRQIVEEHRRTAKPPIVRRVYPTESCYPLFGEAGLLAMFIQRDLSAVELDAMGFELPSGDTFGLTKGTTLLEVWTPQRCLYFVNNKPAVHKIYGEGGITHGYGFVPFAYRVGLEGGELDYGSYGTPLLALVDSNIRMIDQLRTYQLNAIHFVSMPMIYMEYDTGPDAPYKDPLTEAGQFELVTGKIMDFGPGRRPAILAHPGMNKDMFDAVRWHEDEVNRIIPRTLQGIAESSGYNTMQTSAQAKAIFNPIFDGAELLLEDEAVMEMRLIEKFVPKGAPIYLEYAEKDPTSSAKAKVSRVKIEPADIGNYYGIDVQIDRQLDYITEGQAAGNLLTLGVVSKKYVAGKAGIQDYEQVKAERLLDELEDQPEVKQLLMQKAMERFGLASMKEQSDAQGRIVQGADGTPMVQMPDGSTIGPGQLPQLQGPPQNPASQGPIGAMMGGANPASIPGGPNLDSTNNPTINLPNPSAPTARARRRGGAIPGAPQRQGMMRPETQAVA